MLKTLDVVAAILEKRARFCWRSVPNMPISQNVGICRRKVEAGETQPEALIRELREELGIEAVPARYVASHQRRCRSG